MRGNVSLMEVEWYYGKSELVLSSMHPEHSRFVLSNSFLATMYL
jgi:hypothetical protein